MSFMNRKELLKKYYDLETHNALCYSENLLMTKPKKGYEKEWKEAMERADALDALKQESEAKTPYANQINKGMEENVVVANSERREWQDIIFTML